jgi:hypothetical protein
VVNFIGSGGGGAILGRSGSGLPPIYFFLIVNRCSGFSINQLRNFQLQVAEYKLLTRGAIRCFLFSRKLRMFVAGFGKTAPAM